MRRRIKIQDAIFKSLMFVCAAVIVVILGLVIGYIFFEGIELIDWQFLTSDFDAETKYIDVVVGDEGLLIDVGIVNFDTKDYIEITQISKDSPFRSAITNDGKSYPLKNFDILRKIDGINTVGISLDDYNEIINSIEPNTTVRFKVTRPGEGVLPLAVNTFYMIFLALAVALPISIFSAIFLAEYAREGKTLELIRFATSSLSGIPSIVFGLFGALAFVKFLSLGYSLLAGAFTLSIVLLPTVINQTEEALKRVPDTFRQGSFALGATKLQTIFKVILPNSISGIMVGVLLGVGRIVAESAALLLTAGTAAAMASSVFKSASTLTVKAYAVAKETGNVKLASAIGLVAIVLIVVVNALSKIVERFDKMKDVV